MHIGHSKINNGIELYGQAAPSHLDKIQVQQNRILKILFNKDFRTPTLSLHTEINVLMVKDLHKQNVAKFVYQHQNLGLPDVFVNFYENNQSIHDHNTRQANNIHIGPRRTEQGKKMMSYTGAKIWNDLPEYVKNSQTITTFKKHLKKTIVNDY